MKSIRTFTAIFALFAGVLLALPGITRASSAEEINRGVERALRDLYNINPKAREIGSQAMAVLVFPSITKGGFLIAGQHGEGGLVVRGGGITRYYASTAASYGLQAGIQKFGYALFFMNEESLSYLNKSGGWELGSAPSLVVVDEGISKSLSTTTLQKGVYAFFFNQKGLMGGLGLQGSKITRIHPD
jgi:lipid-binding SYLF domain-containing protein